MTTISENGEVILPEEFRKKYGLEPGTPYFLAAEDGELIVKPQRKVWDEELQREVYDVQVSLDAKLYESFTIYLEENQLDFEVAMNLLIAEFLAKENSERGRERRRLIKKANESFKVLSEERVPYEPRSNDKGQVIFDKNAPDWYKDWLLNG